jgi:hypothetical protein
MFPSFDEFLIEKDLPLLVKEFTRAVSYEFSPGRLAASCLLHAEVLEGVRKLLCNARQLGARK